MKIPTSSVMCTDIKKKTFLDFIKECNNNTQKKTKNEDLKRQIFEFKKENLKLKKKISDLKKNILKLKKEIMEIEEENLKFNEKIL